MKKAIILARVSTKEQESSGLSIDKIQLPQLREYAKEHNFEVVEEFVFQETASQKLRKKFDEAIDFVKSRKDIEVIIGFRVDRLTRNYRDAVEMDTLRSEYDKELHFVSDRLVLTKRSVGREIGEWDLKVYLAKQHINRCQEDSFNTLQTKLKSGEQYGLVPFGYKNIKDENGKSSVEVKSFESGIVKIIFELYTIGADSYQTIASKLKLQYPSINFSKRKIEGIIKNPYYYGVRQLNDKQYPHIYPKLITRELFELARNKREGRVSSPNKSKFASKLGLYRSFLFCAECGCSYSASPNRHKRLGRGVQSEAYYYCTNSKGLHSKKPEGTNDHKLTNQFAEIFRTMKIPDKELNWLQDSLRNSHEGKGQFTRSEILMCKTGIDKLQNRIEKAYEDKLDGSITTVQYDKLRKDWMSQKSQLEERLSRINQVDSQYLVTASSLLELASRSYELFKGSEPEQKRQIIGLTLQNLQVKDGSICYHWQKPFKQIFESAKSHKWGG